MYLIHLIHRLVDLIFPVAYKKYLLQVQNEVWPYDDKRFSGHALSLVYPNLRISKRYKTSFSRWEMLFKISGI